MKLHASNIVMEGQPKWPRLDQSQHGKFFSTHPFCKGVCGQEKIYGGCHFTQGKGTRT